MADDPRKEIESFNGELMDLDFGSITVEELEARLELAVAAIPIGDDDCGTNSCGTFCGDCGTNSCNTNCG